MVAPGTVSRIYRAWLSEMALRLTDPVPSLAVMATPSYVDLSKDGNLYHHGHMSEGGEDVPDTAEASYLLDLVHSRANEALTKAREMLSRRPPVSAAAAAMAHQAAGVALRDLGHPREGLAELRLALRSARASGDVQRQADVQASLGL